MTTLDNVRPAHELGSLQREVSELQRNLARSNAVVREFTTVTPHSVQDFISQGWAVDLVRKTRVRLARPMPLHIQVELRVWGLLYKLGFHHLNSKGGAILRRDNGVTDQIDVLGFDDDVCVVVECKSSESERSNVNVGNEVARLKTLVENSRSVLNSSRPRDEKLKFVGVLVLFNVPVTESDRARALNDRIVILDETAIEYYDRLTTILGRAARFQLLGELFAGQNIPGLQLRVPAVEYKTGPHTAYTFAISPAHLLKIAFVAHRGKGTINTYQRMVSRTRLRQIRQYIDDGGLFPTNIVINFQPDSRGNTGVHFEPGPLDEQAVSGFKLGTLIIPPRFQTAWIIDGQHRLLAYADHAWVESAALCVTAFNGLDPDFQAKLFEKINSTQKKVSPNLLAELWATIHWRSPDTRQQIHAIASQVAQDLRSSPASPLRGRILNPDETKTRTRCISMNSLTNGLQRPELFSRGTTRGLVKHFGVFWQGNPDTTFHRAYDISEHWLRTIRDQCVDMWDLGADETSGLVATNRGMEAVFQVLSFVIAHLRRSDPDLDTRSTSQVNSKITAYAEGVGAYFGSLDDSHIAQLRRHLGSGSRPAITYSIVGDLRTRFPDFEPEGFLDWEEERSRVDVNDIQRLCTDIEARLLRRIIEVLRQTHGDNSWWPSIPLTIRQAAASRQQEEPDHPIDKFLMLIDLRDIVTNQWSLFQSEFAIGKQGKEDGTKWLVRLNEIRKRADHSGGSRLRSEDAVYLRELSEQLTNRNL